MKRPLKGRKVTVRTGAIKTDLSTEQLAGIGAVAVAYNDAEASIDRMLVAALDLPSGLEEHVSSRINGVDGKIALVKEAIGRLGLPSEFRTALAEALGEGAFKMLKTYRDATIHVRVLDATRATGEYRERKGKRSEVMLKAEALECVFHQLEELSFELAAYARGIEIARLKSRLALGDPDRASREEDIRACLARAQRCRKARQSLPPLPELPEGPPILRIRLPEPTGPT